MKVLSLFGLMYPLFFIVNILFVLFWLFSAKKSYIFLSIICLLLGYKSIPKFIQFNTDDHQQGSMLTIMSYNVRGSHLSIEEKETYKKIKQYLDAKTSVDVFCFQEKRGNSKSVLNAIMSNFEKSESEFGSVIYSKKPMVDKGRVIIGGNTKEAAWADIKISEGNIIRFYSFHLSSNLITKATDEFIKDPQIQNRKSWNALKGILKSYAAYAIHRDKQLDILLEHASKSPYPVILAGDLNDVPQSHAYQKIAKNRIDSFMEKGFAMGSTFGGKIPFLRIDYLFTDAKFQVLDHNINNVNFSDHFPIEVSLKVDKSSS